MRLDRRGNDDDIGGRPCSEEFVEGSEDFHFGADSSVGRWQRIGDGHQFKDAVSAQALKVFQVPFAEAVHTHQCDAGSPGAGVHCDGG
ncbi:hypothetical protein PJL18_04070 [Paenarthrobacter nicotinovorans]|nr:hypothetical protein [Paenarthrobacter nicotinovorans]